MPEHATQPVLELWKRIGRDAGGIASEVAELLLAEVESYAGIGEEEVRAGIEALVESAARGLAAGRAPGEAELEAAVAIGAERAQQGAPLEAQLRAVRLTADLMLARGRVHVAELGIDDIDVALDAIEAAFDWIDAVSNAITRGYREAEREQQRARAYSAAGFLHSLLGGHLDPPRAESEARSHGLDPAASFRALRARPGGGLPPHRLRDLVAERGGGDGTLAGIIEGDVAALVRTSLDLPDGVVAGIGPAVPLESAAESYARAGEALEAAVAFGRDGVFSVEDLALEVAVMDERIGGALARRLFDPLDQLGERGAALEETLKAFLANGMRFEATARALHVHVNTLRHRLARFEELTALDLKRTEDVVALWGALERRRVQPRHGSL